MPADISSSSLDARMAVLRRPPADRELAYHALMLSDAGMAFPHTRWAGWTDVVRRTELRRSAPVDASYAEVLAQIAAPPAFVLRIGELQLFLIAGGAAMIERSLAEAVFPDVAETWSAFPFGRSGFTDAAHLEAGALKRTPGAKKRMSILKRDGYRCRVCGRRPDEHMDVELEVHHIRPWGEGGVTDAANLITLCRTCHRGLDPHFERHLFSFIDPRDGMAYLEHFDRDVANLRRSNAESV